MMESEHPAIEFHESICDICDKTVPVEEIAIVTSIVGLRELCRDCNYVPLEEGHDGK